MADKRCTIKYDGASKGNPGRAGGGAVIRDGYGNETRVREGFGNATNNEAEYKSLIRGMKTALDQGYEHVSVEGDSELVHKQMEGSWRVRSENLARLHNEATTLKNQFSSWESRHVGRENNREADAEANRGARLGEGQVEMDDY